MQGPDSGLEKMSKQLDAVMDELMGNNFMRLVSSDAWEPQLNLYEAPDRLVLCVNLAGMQPDQIDITAEQGVLQLRGERVRPEPRDCGEILSVQVMEIDSGRFERRINLPRGVDVSRISARYGNGWLWIEFPKGLSR